MPKAQTKATAPTPAPDTPLPVEYAVRIYPVKDSKYTLANAMWTSTAYLPFAA